MPKATLAGNEAVQAPSLVRRHRLYFMPELDPQPGTVSQPSGLRRDTAAAVREVEDELQGLQQAQVAAQEQLAAARAQERAAQQVCNALLPIAQPIA